MENIQMGNQALRRTYYTLFFFSGFSGLIYESIWSHYLKLFLGCAAYAQTLVLVIFMGGMAVGAWLVGRNTDKIKNLFLWYALVEGFIGLLAVIFHSMFNRTTQFAYMTVIPHVNSQFLLNVFKWGLATVLILPQTILLGATFPLMSGGIIRLFPNTPGRSISVLYFANSIGAVAGILISGFVLIKQVGLPGTILTAGMINILIALIVWLLTHRDVYTLKPSQTQTSGASGLSANMLGLMLVCAALTGTASFMYEIGWIRMLCLVLGSSTHAFELMLSAFILGLALGGYWIKRRIDDLINPIKTLGWIQIIMGLLAFSTIGSYGQTFNLMSYILKALARTSQGYTFFNILSQLIASLVMVPATFCAGMTLPLITFYLLSKNYGEGSIGKIYASNTLGSILGVLLGVQLVMPVLGMKNVIVIGAVLDTTLGLVLLWNAGPDFPKKRWVPLLIVLSLVFLSGSVFVKLDPMKMASGVYRTAQIERTYKILFHKDGKTASVDVFQESNKRIVISTNGKPDASIGSESDVSFDEPTQTLSAALSYALHPKTQNVGVIGIGSGMTSRVLLAVPAIKQVDLVEIEPAMIEGSKKFGKPVEAVFTDPRCRIHIEDAKTFFTNQKKSYDLILSEPSNPWVSGVSGLFSKEFYQLIKRHIRPDGLYVQWVQLYELNPFLFATIARAISECFNDYTIYFTIDGDALIIAGEDVQSREPDESIFHIPELKPLLERIRVLQKSDLALRKLSGKKILDPLFKSYGVPANSDFFPILDLYAVQARYLATNAEDLFELLSVALPVLETLEKKPAPSGPTSVSEVPYSRFGTKAYQATLIYRYFKQLPAQDKTCIDALNLANLQTIRNIRSVHAQKNPSELQKAWLPYLHGLMQQTLPFLSPKEMDVVWNDIGSSLGSLTLPDTLGYWIHLYRAVGKRNVKDMLKYATALLPDSTISVSYENNYCLTAAMLAHIEGGQYNEAIRLWNRYQNKSVPPVTIRLLKETASERMEPVSFGSIPKL